MQPALPSPSARFKRPAARATLREWGILTLLLAALSGVLGHLGGLGRSDQTLYDAAVSLNTRKPLADVVVIGIDEKSLAQIGRWPWPRAVHAALLDQLQGARPKAIGLDLILAEPEPSSAGVGGDAALARSLKAAGNVALPVLTESRVEEGRQYLYTSLPAVPLPASAATLGHIHLEIDQDGIARSVFLREGIGTKGAPAAGWPHFSLALRNLAGAAGAELPGERETGHATAASWQRDYWMHIPFAGPPGSFAPYSYVDVLKGEVPQAAFAGKYVLIGATAAGMGDAYPTPVSGRSRPMAGVEISANVLAALLEGKSIVRAGPWANSAFSVLPVLLLMGALLLFSPRRGLLTAGLMIVLTLAASYLLLRAGVWFAPASALLGLILAYPLWSWRRLEATMQYLGAELLRLNAEPRVLPEDPHADPQAGADLVERRIFALETAAGRLRAARRFVSDTIESLPDATLVVDRDSGVLIANRAAAGLLFQAPIPEELRGRRVAELISPFATKADPAAPLAWAQLQDLAAQPPDPSGAPASLELAPYEGRDLLARCAACTDAAGEAAGWIISLIDISPLREAERTRDEVLSFLSHDMRSPQSSILALLELHELDPEDNPKEAVHERIAQYAHRTLELSEQFLQLARAETKEYEFENVDLGVIAEEALEEAWAAAEQKHIALKLHFDGEPVPVKADPALLRRALINLLTNAVKYSPENTTTTIRVHASDEWAQCEVADQGYGMSEENLQDLFKRFRRFSRPGQPKAQGAGLGMAFVKTVAERHGGRILVQSQPGVGTTFTLQLPPSAD